MKKSFKVLALTLVMLLVAMALVACTPKEEPSESASVQTS